MKKFFTLLFAASISVGAMAQGNSHGKAKGKSKVKEEKHENKMQDKKGRGDDDVYYPTQTSVKSKGNQPKKVREAFMRDYPGATNVSWSKYQGDWTATFNNGMWRSTAVYHANGDRRDTRTPIRRTQLPGTIWTDVFQRDNVTPVGNIIRIETPTLKSEIFRIVSQLAGATPQYVYYDANGQRVNYNY